MYLRERLGVAIRGDAWKQVPNAPLEYADVGDVMLFDYGGVGKDHVALIVGFQGAKIVGTAIVPEYIVVSETNYTRCKPGTRLIPWEDPSIKGVIDTQQAGVLSTP